MFESAHAHGNSCTSCEVGHQPRPARQAGTCSQCGMLSCCLARAHGKYTAHSRRAELTGAAPGVGDGVGEGGVGAGVKTGVGPAGVCCGVWAGVELGLGVWHEAGGCVGHGIGDGSCLGATHVVLHETPCTYFLTVLT
jgi:hypothetical protein